MPTPARRTWTAIVRLLERDERVFAFLLAVVMVGGLATLGLALRPRHRIDLPSLVFWFAMYKVGILALVSVNPRSTRVVFSGALAVDLLLIFALLYLTGGGASLFYLLFVPLLPVNAYYFGPWMGFAGAIVAGLLYAAAAALAADWVGWNAVIILIGLVGLPALAVGMVANRERRARAEVERLNAELTGTLTRLQGAQAELVVAERMATVGRLSLKVAHEVRNPIAAIELNAELVGDLVRERGGADMEEAATLVTAIREQVNALDAITEEYLAFARFPRPQYDEDSVNEMVAALVEFVRPVAARQGSTVEATTDQTVPPMAIDRTLLRQSILNLVKNGLEALGRGGKLTVSTRRVNDHVEIAIQDTGPGIASDVSKRLFEQFFTTKPQGTGLGLYISRQIIEEHGGTLRWESAPGAGTTFTATLPIKRTQDD
ncbi:MAG TPA: ATP-binding protein [Methylomirabilota bacterium]|nr:ATP-binding protein [Methylomirabilota bacterium]